MKSRIDTSLRTFLLAVMVLFVAASCKKDEEKECVVPALEKHVLNTWQAGVNAMGTTLPSTAVTFTEAGEIEGGLGQYLKMIPGIGEIDDLIQYQVSGDNTVNVIVTEDGQVNPFPLTVTERDCDKIVLSSPLQVTITLTK